MTHDAAYNSDTLYQGVGNDGLPQLWTAVSCGRESIAAATGETATNVYVAQLTVYETRVTLPLDLMASTLTAPSSLVLATCVPPQGQPRPPTHTMRT